jgi:transposase
LGLQAIFAGRRNRAPQQPAAPALGPRDAGQGSRESSGRELERLRRQNQDLRQQNQEFQRKIADAEKQHAEDQKKIADLERQLTAYQKDSTNSSKPPSTDGGTGTKQKQRYPKREKSRRKPGGQKGHPGKHRPLVPLEQVKKVVAVEVKACRHCGSALPAPGDPGYQTEGEVQRHQVVDVPPIRPEVTQYQRPRVVCPCCHKGTRAPLPPEAQKDFAPGLAALVAYWTVTCRMPRSVVRTLLETVLGIPISLGSVQHLWEEAGEAVKAPCQELEEQLPKQALLNIDGSGWWNNAERRVIVVLVAAQFVCYRIVASHNWETVLSWLGAAFAGVLCSDRGSEYRKYRRLHPGLIQYCWAHLKRNIQGVLDFATTEKGRQFCRDALAVQVRLFRLWHAFRRQVIDRPQLIEKSIHLEKKLFALAERQLDNPENEVRNLARALFENFEHLFTFIYRAGVEPTNNAAERALRIAVQWRKIMFGNRSARGEVTVARLLTVSQTCLLQERSALDYLAQAIACHRRGEPVPSLLPPAK